MSDDTTPSTGLRIGHVPGVTLNKWRRTWGERFSEPLLVEEVGQADQLAGLRDGSLDMCFVRLPIDREGLHAIPLYEERMVAWVAKDHVFAAVDEVASEDLADEQVLTEVTPTATDLVLGGAVLVVPMSIARGASRRDLTYRPVVDADTSPVALAWRIDADNPLIDEFIGVVRGRTAHSSRTRQERAASDPRHAAAVSSPTASRSSGRPSTGRKKPTHKRGRRS